MNLFDKLRSKIIVLLLKAQGATVGKNVLVCGKVKILLRDGADMKNLIIGDNVTFGGTVYIRMRKNGKIVIGNGVKTGTEVWFVSANDARLDIGENSIIGSYTILNGGHGLSIGANCIFAAFVYINTSDHNYARHTLIQKQGFFGAPVSIGGDVWIGGHVFINKGVSIGYGAIIGAGAVVLKNVPEYSIAVGNPAKVIKERV